MKILDRYIASAVASSFVAGVAMFMVLLMAMSMLKQLIELIADKGIAPLTAITIFADKIPGMMVYAFPMSTLLAILLVFSRMSSESEMVAIRAGGTSFARVVAPTLGIALLVAGLTFWVSNTFVPYATTRSTQLEARALQKVQQAEPIKFLHTEQGQLRYSIVAGHFDYEQRLMRQVTVVFYDHTGPVVMVYADSAHWDAGNGHWRFPNGTVHIVKSGAPSVALYPNAEDSEVTGNDYASRIQEDPFDLLADKRRKPEAFSAEEIQRAIIHMTEIHTDPERIGEWRMGYQQRYAVPFASLVFALIGAPLGLRNHRASSAVGLGLSLLIIFAYYFFSTYLTTFGKSGVLPPVVAAWLPNTLGVLLGIILIVRANR